MKKAFKKIALNEEVPKELKVKVMDSVNGAKTLLDLVELFTGRYIQTIGNLFKTDDHSKE